jgi:hypothetical protein
MAKPLACRIGRHKWSTKVEHGETYAVCTACGKERPPATGGSAEQPNQKLGSGGRSGDT